MSIISIRDLVVEYDGRRVLDGLSLDIEAGETMVLLGGSGSGKSTLLRHMIGLERPHSGSISIKGSISPAVRRRNSIWFGAPSESHFKVLLCSTPSR